MGKERLIESARQGLESTKELIRKRPYTVVYGIGVKISLISFVGATISGNIPAAIVGSLGLVLNAGGVAGNVIVYKRERSTTQILEAAIKKLK